MSTCHHCGVTTDSSPPAPAAIAGDLRQSIDQMLDVAVAAADFEREGCIQVVLQSSCPPVLKTMLIALLRARGGA